ncbi:MAG: hypothetical protein M1832_002615 [Thelocarpon impressellum]|nr:MAG: hypothetical protein M1832_002615 [Thelocarpon impressellum]
MASVSSLDKDLRNMRLSKYSPQAAKEVREWIEEVLSERLAAGDLLDALKDGQALCKLVNLAVPPGIKYKTSAMPFVQMENISLFLHACQKPPLGLPPHDVFLTVDLYEHKDPAQVLQCLGAFSRRAHALQPASFPRSIGPKSRGAGMSPHRPASPARSRGLSSASQTSSSTFDPTARSTTGSTGQTSSASPQSSSNGGGPSTPKGAFSSWSKKSDEGATAPAWNIHQYGYMGGASQGNQGIAFGARRQITSPAPKVPSMAEKERKRREEEAEKERLRALEEQAERTRQAEREAEEERERMAEEQRWEEETKRQRERERIEAEAEKRRWEAEEARWKAEEQRRLKEEREAQARLEADKAKPKSPGAEPLLHGQFLSQYQAEQHDAARPTPEQERVRQLERELEQAKEREKQYERERQEQKRADRGRERKHLENHDLHERQKVEEQRARSRSGARPGPSQRASAETGPQSWRESERDYLRREWGRHHKEPFGTTPPAEENHRANRPLPVPSPTSPIASHEATRPLPDPTHFRTPSPTKSEGRGPFAPGRQGPLSPRHQDAPPLSPRHQDGPPPSPRPLPDPASTRVMTHNTGPSSRPLPDPVAYASSSGSSANRTDRFLASNPAPVTAKPTTHLSGELGFDSAAERHAEDRRREESRAKTQAGGWASKSLLEREMERERQRQQEWEEAQRGTQEAAGRSGGGARDLGQFDFGLPTTDNQNKGGQGIGGGRRQIIGPRPPR